jgi:hemoglobin-like flavoprotein
MQGTTTALSIFEERRRKVLEAVGGSLRWVTDIHFDGSPDDALSSDVVPIVCGGTDAATTKTTATGERQTTTFLGTIQSEPSSVFGNEDPFVWSSRRNGTAECIVDVPSSLPVIFTTNAVVDRIAAWRARKARLEAYSQAGIDEVAATNTDVEEPPCKFPLILYTRALLTLPSSLKHGDATKTFCLGRCTTRVGNARDLVGGVAEAKINVIGSDLSAALAHCFVLETGISAEEDDAPSTSAVVDTESPSYNPYELDVDRGGNLVEAAPSRQARDTASYPISPPPRTTSRFGDREEETTPRSGDGAASEGTEMGRGDDENIVGFAYVSFNFADLGPAVGPVTSVIPDTLLGDTAAKLLDTADRQQLAKVTPPPPFALSFALLPPTASMKLGAMNGKAFAASAATSSLKWSKAPQSVPYGCMSLVDLYQHLATIYTNLYAGSSRPPSSTANPVPSVKVYKPLLKQLIAHDAACGRDPLTGQYRWELVRQLSLLRFILGEINILPVLSLLVCCRGLEHVDLDMNSLKVTTAKRMVECLRKHPRLQSISLRSNEFYESAGEQILRLMKLNRSIVVCNLEGNYFTPALTSRLSRALASNVAEFQADTTNFMSGEFAYMDIDVVKSTPGTGCAGLYKLVPEESIQQVLAMWSIMGCAPSEASLGAYEQPPIISKLGNSTNETAKKKNIEDDTSGGGGGGSGATRQGIPTIAMAPLLSQAMRAVQIELSTTHSEDRILTGVFKDFGGVGVAANVVSGEDGLLQDVDVTTRAYPIPFRPTSAANRNPAARAVLAGMDSAAPNMQAIFSRSYSKMLTTGLRAIMRAVASGAADQDGVESSGRAVGDSSYWSEAMDALMALGDAHYRMGVRPSHYMAANRYLLTWMKAVLSSTEHSTKDGEGGRLGSFTAASSAAWSQVLALICRITLSGCPIGQQLLLK